jgi:hypothetical protein
MRQRQIEASGLESPADFPGVPLPAVHKRSRIAFIRRPCVGSFRSFGILVSSLVVQALRMRAVPLICCYYNMASDRPGTLRSFLIIECVVATEHCGWVVEYADEKQ